MATRRRREIPAAGEFIIPVAAIAFTAYYIWSVRDGPWEAKFSAYLVGTGLIISSAIFLLTRIWRLATTHREPGGGETRWWPPRPVTLRRLALLVLTLGYILAIDYGAGFTLSNFAFLTCGIILLSGVEHWLRAAGVAAALSLGGYLLFIVAFHTRFPEGPFEQFMSRLLS
ncbi:MAG: tripartite tricarboxylate transporter TctB family protein [Ectothiorhodospiraceae bacterium]|nr:tripartite tricarboxylate transporter TctB family protein [Ectothiorhodospiraceae bacterium]